LVQVPGPSDIEDSEQELLLVHGLNDPVWFRPELLSLNVTKIALVLVKSETSVPNLFHQGPNKNVSPFTHADIAEASPGFAAVLPSKLDSYLLLALLVSIPILYGVDSTICCPVTEGHVNCFENNLPGSSWWLDHIILWSVAVQATVIADKVTLKGKKVLPTLWNPVFIDSIFLSSQGVTTDLKNEITIAFSSLKKLVESIDLLNKPPLNEVMTSSPRHIPQKLKHKATNNSISSTEAEEPTYTTRDYRRARFLLASHIIDDKGTFTPPTLTPDGWAIFKIKDTKMANSAMLNIFTMVMDKFHCKRIASKTQVSVS
jgi:hypothetical protein